MTGVLTRREDGHTWRTPCEGTDTQEEHCVTTGAEVGAVHPEGKDHWPPTTARKR
jgi:hypothetical protein